MRKLAAASFVAFASFAFLAPSTRAQDDSTTGITENRVSLTAHGTARKVADAVDIEFVVEASDEDATSAEKKHRDKLARLVKALKELKASIDERVHGAAGKESPSGKPAEPPAGEALPKKAATDDAPAARPKKKKPADDEDEDEPRDRKKHKASAEEDSDADPVEPPTFSIELREGRSMLGVSRDNQNGQGTPTSSVTVATAVIVHMDGLAEVSRPRLRKRLAQILDKAIEAGADSGGVDSGGPIGHGVRPAFRFRVNDNEGLREAAYKEALRAGKRRAQSLARLAGRELGMLTSVQETSWNLRAGADDTGAGFDVMVGRVGNNRPNNHDLLTSTTEIELEVGVAIEYELGKPLPQAPETPAK